MQQDQASRLEKSPIKFQEEKQNKILNLDHNNIDYEKVMKTSFKEEKYQESYDLKEDNHNDDS